VTVDLDAPRSLGFLRLRRWDGDTALKQQVRYLLSRHSDVIYADIDLATVEDVDEATAASNDLGFFVSGLILHGADGHDHLRLQLLDSTESSSGTSSARRSHRRCVRSSWRTSVV
jgi:hypothetical protein